MCLSVLVLTALNMVDLFKTQDLGDDYTLNYTVFTESFHSNLLVLRASTIFVVLFTGFFTFPFILLGNIQLSNFCKNQTTNERFSRSHRGRKQSASVSQATSQISMTTSIMAEDIVKVMGEADDHSKQCCSCAFNLRDMICTKGIPN